MEKFSNAWNFAQNVHQKFTKRLQDPFSPMELPKITIPKFYKAKLNKGEFAIMESNDEMPVIHVAIDLEKLSKSFSIYRATEMEEAERVLDRFYKEKLIFELIATDASLNKLVALLHTHPDWATIHFVASMDLLLYFNPFRVEDYEKCLNLQTPSERYTPLHLAIMNGHRSTIVEKLISLGADVAIKDKTGRNAFHHAALISRNMIKVLVTEHSTKILSTVNAVAVDGLSPLFLALTNDGARDDVITELLALGADPQRRCGIPVKKPFITELMNKIKEPKNTKVMKLLLDIAPQLVNDQDQATGETAFHYCKDKESLMLLIDNAGCHCNMNIQNKGGQTPLHKFASRGCLDSCVQILAYGANPNVQDDDGNTALHLEVMSKIDSLSPDKADPALVRLLLLFGADPFIKNNRNENVRDLLVNSKFRKLLNNGIANLQTKFYRTRLEDLLSSINVCFTDAPSEVDAADREPSPCSKASIVHAQKQGIDKIKQLKRELGLTMKEMISRGELSEAANRGIIVSARSNADLLDSFGSYILPHFLNCTKRSLPPRAATVGNLAALTNSASLSSKAANSDDEDVYEGIVIPKPINPKRLLPVLPKLPKIINCLSLDGGGIRGLVAVQIIMFIEKRLGRRLRDCFHWIGGTSVGGIFALYLAQGHTVSECQCLLFRFKDVVFKDVVFKDVVPPCNTSALERCLQSTFTEKTFMSDIVGVRVMVTATKANENPPRLDLFRNYELPIKKLNVKEILGYYDPKTLPVWKVARCTIAAPSFFTTMEWGASEYLNGGLIAKNPSLELLSEVQNYNDALVQENSKDGTVTLGCLLSIGTGFSSTKSRNHRLELQMPENPWDMVIKGIATKDFPKLLIDQVCAAEGTPVDRTRSWCHSMQTPFYRFSPPLTHDFPVDTKDDRLIIQMCWETFEYMHKHKQEVDELVDLLTT